MRLLIGLLLLVSSAAWAEGDGEGRARRLKEASMERRVFRQVFVGLVTYPSLRLTWVLYRGGDQARLAIFCQEGNPSPTKGIRLDGRELDEAYWLAPVVVRYAGKRTKPLAWDLVLEEGPKEGKSRCASPPPAVSLVCSQAKVGVRPAGAVLVPGRAADPEDQPPPTWKPPAQQKLAALKCQPTDDGLAIFGILVEHPAVFAPATEAMLGVEWVEENSDMVVQENAYRRLGVRP